VIPICGRGAGFGELLPLSSNWFYVRPNKDAAELAIGAVEAIPGAEGHQVLEGR
jgi:hypothetical protein